MQRPRVSRARAAMRLASEPLITVTELGAQVLVPPMAMIRWITEGKGGVYLDGLHRPGVGWMTSRAAFERFKAKCKQREDRLAKTEGPR